MTAIEDLQRDIASRLERKLSFRSVAKTIIKCQRGACTRCGDACPIRAARWLQDKLPSMLRLLRRSNGASIREFYLSRTTWSREAGDLAEASVDAAFKTVRRALDSLREPLTFAVGVFDASWGPERWNVGARVLVTTPPGVDLCRAFDHTKDIDGPLELLAVPHVDRALKQLFRDGQQAKSTTWSADGNVPRPSLRGEYYSWLAGLAAGDRLFRYGCDRYFNRLKKTALPIHHKAKKGHPNPFWLESCWYGNHETGCECRICRGRRN